MACSLMPAAELALKQVKQVQPWKELLALLFCTVKVKDKAFCTFA